MSNYVKLGTLTNIKTGKLDANAAIDGGEYLFFTCSKEPLCIDSFSYDCECVLVAGNGDLNVKYYEGKFEAYQRTYIIESMDKDKLLVKYLYFFLDSYVAVLRMQSIGGVIKYIKLGNLTDAVIPLPNIDKQQEIVNLLDGCEGLIAARKQQLKLLDELVKSRFIEMFGDPVSNPMGWVKVKLSQCLTGIDNGKSFVCDPSSKIGDEPAVLKLSAVTYGYYKPEENKAMIDMDQFIENAEVHSGDLLFTRKNTPELVGMCAYVYETPTKLMMPDLIFRLNVSDYCDKVFLWKLINHDLYRPCIKNIATGSAKSMSNISKERLMELSIILPPIELQQQFAAFVAQADKSKLAAKKGLQELEILKKSLMQQYFG